MRAPQRILAAVTVVLAGAICTLAVPSAPSATPSATRALLAEVNRVRTDHGLRPLGRDARLTRAAQGHAADLLRRNVFEHGDVEGRARLAGARGPRFGENLAWGSGQFGPRRIVQLWMDSPPHRRNLLRPGWRRAGIGMAIGTFSGTSGTRIVALELAGR